MRTEKGFVAATPDGEYLIWYERSTHTGYHLDFGIAPHIDRATFSHVANDRQWPMAKRGSIPPHTWVPVTRRTEVTLDGYGVAP